MGYYFKLELMKGKERDRETEMLEKKGPWLPEVGDCVSRAEMAWLSIEENKCSMKMELRSCDG